MSKTETYDVQIAGTTDGGDRVPDLTPREATERWLNKIRVSKADSTVSSYHYRLKHFVEFCEREAITSMSDLTGWDLETFETERREQGLEPLSLNREMGTLKNFFRYCARIELVDEDLPEKVDPPDVPRDAQVDDTQLHAKDAQHLLEYYDNNPEDRFSRAHALLATAWYTGVRLGALRGLDLNDYNADEAYLQFNHRPREDTPLKNGYDGERMVGIPDELSTILNEYIDRHRHDNHDEHGRPPLFTSEVGRGSQNATRAWMYLATVPCLHGPCPHGNERDSCDFLTYSTSSQCPSSRSPHQVRTGSVTWQLNRGMPLEVVAERVNTSVRVLKRHYDQPTKKEELEERRRHHLNRLSFDEGGDLS